MNLAPRTVFDWDTILDGIEVFYVSGVTPAVSPEMAAACEDALSACRQRGITTVCDLNYRGRLWSPERAREVMKRLLPLVDVCISNDEDAAACLGISHGSGSLATGIEERDAYVRIAADVCERYGCKMVASIVRDIRSVEDSDWTSLIYAEGQARFSSIHHVHVLEGVAAGDAYGAGLIHALLHGYGLDRAGEYAIAASVLKLTVRGDSNLVSVGEIESVAKSGTALRVSR